MKLRFPVVIVNFKCYPQATGDRAVGLAELIESVASESGVSAAVCPQFADIYRIAMDVKIPVFAQHSDPLSPGRGTGWILPESLRAAGASGTLINHSEHKLQLGEVERVIARAREAGLLTVACAVDEDEGKAIAKMGPDMIAVEPPELIGTGISVSKAKPDIVRGSVRCIKDVDPNVAVLCGAGITAGEDVARAIELGSEGVLISSGVVCAKDQGAAFRDIVSGMR